MNDTKIAINKLLRKHWKNVALWSFWNLVGMFTLWVTGSVLFFFIEHPEWVQLLDKGQFFVYSVGILVQVMYIVIKERTITIIPYRSLLTSAAAATLLFCTLLFCGTVLSSIGDNAIVSSRLWVLRLLSIVMFIGSILLGAFATVMEEERQEIDMSDLSQQSYQRLENKVEDQLPESST